MYTHEDKLNWIKDYMKTVQNHVDILNREFSDAYIAKFNPPHLIQPFGANTCPELGKMLALGFKNGMFIRNSVGIQAGYWGMPKWVYVYHLKEDSN